MSEYTFKVSFIFLVLLSVGRIIFPFGDEPDFEVRVDRLVALEKISFNFHEYGCKITSGPESIHSNISSECIELNLKYFFETPLVHLCFGLIYFEIREPYILLLLLCVRINLREIKLRIT